MAAPSKSSQPKHNPTYAKPSKIKASSASSSSHAVPSSSQASSKAAASLSAKQTPSHALLQTSGGSSTAVIDTLPLHQTILDNIQTLVFVLDAHKTILWANRKARQIFKKTILGKPCHEVLYHYHQACKACEQMRSRAVSLAQATRRKAPIPCTAHTTTLGQYEIIELLLPKKTSSLPTPSLSHNSQQLQALIALSQKATVLSNDTAILEMVCSTLTKKMGYRFALVFLFPEKPEEKGVFSYSAQAIQHRVFERWFSTFQHQLLTHPFFEQLHKGTQQLQVPLSTFFTQFDLPPSVLSPSISPSQLQGTVVLTLLKTKVGKKGVLCTVNKSSTPDDLVLASTVATLVANALQNVYYQHSLKQKLLDLEQLHKLSQNMTTTSQFALMKQILDLAIEKTKAVSGSIMILNHDEKKLETIYARGRGIRKNFSEITFPVGVGAAGIVAKTGERLIIENKLTDDRYINVGSKTWTKNAYIGIPLKFKKSVLGVLNIDFRSKDDLSKDVLTYLTIISNTASVIIRNNQLYNHYVLRVKRLSVMYDIAKAIAATLDFEQVLDLIVKRIAQLMDTTLCSIFLVDQNKKELVLKSFYPSSIQLMEEVSIPIASTVSGEAFIAREIKQDNLFSSEEQYYPRIFKEQFKLQSFLSVPLILEEEAIGVINLYSSHDRKFYSGEIDLLKGIADMAAIAIEKSLLYHRIKTDKEVFATITKISSMLNSTLDYNTLFGLMLQKAVEHTRSDRGILFLEQNGKLVVKEMVGYPPEFQALVLDPGQGISGECFVSKKPIIVDNVQLDKRYIKGDKDEFSEAAYPIILRGKVIGVLNLESQYYANYHQYHELLTILMEKFALAIENASLHKSVLDFNTVLKKEVEKATKHLQESNERLRQLDKIKDEFLSNVSHELRTPLTSIKGYSQLLGAQRLGPLNDLQKESLQIIIKESERLTRLINDILDLSKLEAGKATATFRLHSVEELIKESIQTFFTQAQEKKITLSYIAEPIAPIALDYDMIMRVFDNLIGNAIKFTGEGGKIIIELKDRPDAVEVSVTDTGRGIPPDQLQKIFNKFYQIDPTITKSIPGTGLGLSIAKNIIALHQGTIEVKSTEGKGSTFTFTIAKNLPLTPEKKKGKQTA